MPNTPTPSPKPRSSRPVDRASPREPLMVDAVTEVTRLLQETNEGLGRLVGMLEPPAAAPPAHAMLVESWGDDPFSEAVASPMPRSGLPGRVALHDNNNRRLALAIREPQPGNAGAQPGTPEFRYWVAAEALNRGIVFWSELLPQGATWSAANPMPVQLQGPDQELNANYTRFAGLRFYGRRVAGIDIHSCESADVVLHELGHAILDGIRPELFHTTGFEFRAFHESFGDISAILGGLQSAELRRKVLQETGGKLNVNSRLSRVAEQLGWGIRQLMPTAVDRDSLRNAANRFFYTRPDQLPPSGPASQLSAQSHSFSRVFTGGFLDALALMLIADGPVDDAALQRMSRTIGKLLVDAVLTAPLGLAYFSELAAAMVQADQTRNGGRYRKPLIRAFMERGILSVSSAMALSEAPVPAVTAAVAADGPGVSTQLAYAGVAASIDYGLGLGETRELPLRTTTIGGTLEIEVHATDKASQLSLAPAMTGIGPDDRDAELEARLFIEGLIQERRVGLRGVVPARTEGIIPDVAELEGAKATHEIVAAADGKLVLKRLQFRCACNEMGAWQQLFTDVPGHHWGT